MATARRETSGSSAVRWGFALGTACALLAVFWVLTRPSEVATGPQLTHTVQRGDLRVTVVENGTLESAENTEIKCRVRGRNTVIWVIESGSYVEPGDVLVRLDSLFIEEQIDERTKYAHWSRSAAEHSEAQLARTKLAVTEYEEGRYVAELMRMEKDLAIAEADHLTARNMFDHAKMLAENGYISELEVERREFAVTQSRLEVDVKKTEIDVLKRFTKAEQLETLRGDLAATRATHQANAERATADASRRDRAVDEFQHCVVRAERAGLVIHPSAARWENAPEIAEGTSVWKEQVMLLMPDLSQMQVKVGIHERVIDRVSEGLSVQVTLPDRVLSGEVSSVASVTRPAGWWTANEVRYDTVIKLPDEPGLWPGMSAEVEVLIAEYQDVLKVPVAAIVDSAAGSFCWVATDAGPERRAVELGDSNEVFTIVKSGIGEGERVILNPLALESPVAEDDGPRMPSEAEAESESAPPAPADGKKAIPPGATRAEKSQPKPKKQSPAKTPSKAMKQPNFKQKSN